MATTAETAKSPLSSIVGGWRHEQSDILQHADPWAQNEPKSVSSAKGCFSVNFPTCSVSEIGRIHSRFANDSFPSTTSRVRENVDLKKFQLKSLPV